MMMIIIVALQQNKSQSMKVCGYCYCCGRFLLIKKRMQQMNDAIKKLLHVELWIFKCEQLNRLTRFETYQWFGFMCKINIGLIGHKLRDHKSLGYIYAGKKGMHHW